MYDTHSHLLFGVDDGCKDIETSLELLRLAEEEGILGIVLTPHYMNEGRYRKQRDEIVPVFETLKQAAKDAGLSIELYLGNEIYCSASAARLLSEGKISTYNGGHYVLVEFGFQEYKPEYDEYLYDLAIEGYKVIIAHVERYQFVQKNPQMVYEWIRQGYYCQVNQDSITGKNGTYVQRLAMDLLAHHQIHIICSDAHRIGRIVTLKEAKNIVARELGEDYARELFVENPLAVIEDREIIKRKPTRLEAKKRFFDLLFHR